MTPEFKAKVDAAAERWKQEHGMKVQLPPLAYYGMERGYISGAEWAIAEVAAFLEAQEPTASGWRQAAYSFVRGQIEKRFMGKDNG